MQDYMAADYDKVTAQFPVSGAAVPTELSDTVSWAFVAQGNAFSDQAKTKSGAEADRLFDLAGEKYEAALKIKPDKHEALNNWGNALLEQAKTKSGVEADRLFDLAREKCLATDAIVPGKGAYNLACISALQGQEAECREWLEKSKTHGELPSRDHMLKDADLASVRDKDWFQALIGT
jgi:Tfp pilus assembly protein PilF